MASYTVFIGARLRVGTITYSCLVTDVADEREAFEAAKRNCAADLGIDTLGAKFRFDDAQFEA